MLKNKKGAELSINVVIIAILVIIVLIVVAAFFMGGFTNVMNRVRTLIWGPVVGVDTDLAIAQCQTLCAQAQNLQTEDAKEKSRFCTTVWNLDTKSDGDADYIDEDQGGDKTKDKLCKYYCKEDPLNVPCVGVAEHCPTSYTTNCQP
jgi:hypothetical protein